MTKAQRIKRELGTVRYLIKSLENKTAQDREMVTVTFTGAQLNSVYDALVYRASMLHVQSLARPAKVQE